MCFCMYLTSKMNRKTFVSQRLIYAFFRSILILCDCVSHNPTICVVYHWFLFTTLLLKFIIWIVLRVCVCTLFTSMSLSFCVSFHSPCSRMMALFMQTYIFLFSIIKSLEWQTIYKWWCIWKMCRRFPYTAITKSSSHNIFLFFSVMCIKVIIHISIPWRSSSPFPNFNTLLFFFFFFLFVAHVSHVENWKSSRVVSFLHFIL